VKKSAKQELRAKPAEDLHKEIQKLNEDMLKSRVTGTLEGKRIGIRYRAARRQIARINTILRERELAPNKAK
jgi:ribosomal protein L29